MMSLRRGVCNVQKRCRPCHFLRLIKKRSWFVDKQHIFYFNGSSSTTTRTNVGVCSKPPLEQPEQAAQLHSWFAVEEFNTVAGYSEYIFRRGTTILNDVNFRGLHLFPPPIHVERQFVQKRNSTLRNKLTKNLFTQETRESENKMSAKLRKRLCVLYCHCREVRVESNLAEAE